MKSGTMLSKKDGVVLPTVGVSLELSSIVSLLGQMWLSLLSIYVNFSISPLIYIRFQQRESSNMLKGRFSHGLTLCKSLDFSLLAIVILNGLGVLMIDGELGLMFSFLKFHWFLGFFLSRRWWQDPMQRLSISLLHLPMQN